MSIEVTLSYDLAPGIDEQGYWDFIKKNVSVVLNAGGIEELRAHRNALGSPLVRITMVWESIAAWARFIESDAGQTLQNELRGYGIGVKVDVWMPSPYIPEPLTG